MTLVKIGVSTNRMRDYTPLAHVGKLGRVPFDGGLDSMAVRF
jgi:hypothetical protein